MSLQTPDLYTENVYYNIIKFVLILFLIFIKYNIVIIIVII